MMKHLFTKQTGLACILALHIASPAFCSLDENLADETTTTKEFVTIKTALAPSSKGPIALAALGLSKILEQEILEQTAQRYLLALKFIEDGQDMLEESLEDQDVHSSEDIDKELATKVTHGIMEHEEADLLDAIHGLLANPKTINIKMPILNALKDILQTDDGKLSAHYRVKSNLICTFLTSSDAKEGKKVLEDHCTCVEKATELCVEFLWLINGFIKHLPPQYANLKDRFEKAIKAEIEKGKSLTDYLSE